MFWARGQTTRRSFTTWESPAPITGEKEVVVFVSNFFHRFVDEWAVGEYHSAYDDFYWMNRFGADNRTYDMYVCLAQFTGTLLMDLARDTQGLDLNATAYALAEYSVLLAKTGSSLDLTALNAAIADFAETVQSSTFATATTLQLERQFLFQAGLPHRPFFRHLLQAPGINLGYGSVTFPGVTQAVTDNNATQALEQLSNLISVIQAATHFLQTSKR
jgi:N-acetylated-alpha-linked acidic dipeptidase